MSTKSELIKRRKRWQWVNDYGWCIVAVLGLAPALAWVSVSDRAALFVILAITTTIAVAVYLVSDRALDKIGQPGGTIAQVVNSYAVTVTTPSGLFTQDDVGKEMHFPRPAVVAVSAPIIDGVERGWVDAP